MREIPGEEDAIKVMILAIKKIIRQNSLDNIKEWYEDTYLYKLYPGLALSSSSLSEFLQKIGKSDIINRQILRDDDKVTEAKGYIIL